MKNLLFSIKTPSSTKMESNWAEKLLTWYQSLLGNICCAAISSWHVISQIAVAISDFENSCPNDTNTKLACGKKWRGIYCCNVIWTASGNLKKAGIHLKVMHIWSDENQQELHHFPICKIQYKGGNSGSYTIIFCEFW